MNTEVLRDEIADLEKKLKEKRALLQQYKQSSGDDDDDETSPQKLSNEEITKFSRQIIMPEIGVQGQINLRKSSVLVVGAGGLGCPSALYLTGAGVGHIGIVDYDEVELNNLHRQLLHTEASVGQPKVHSATETLKRLNSSLKVTPYHIQLDSSNALDIVKQYNVVVDATDNVATRYLLNDACVLTEVPLVSGSALQMEGQLTVYNYNGGPCYRCLFPVPPPPETVTNCGDGGVLGVVPGVIGLLQALETIKLLLGHPGVLFKKMLIFDGSDCSFRSFQLRDKNPSCAVCGRQPSVTKLVDYEQFCHAKANDKDTQVTLLDNVHRMTATAYQVVSTEPHVLVDVRSPMEFEICHLPDSLNVPLKDISSKSVVERLKKIIAEKSAVGKEFPVIVVCRRGNDSQKGVVALRKVLNEIEVSVKDIIGGLHSWAHNVDPSFPVY